MKEGGEGLEKKKKKKKQLLSPDFIALILIAKYSLNHISLFILEVLQ